VGARWYCTRCWADHNEIFPCSIPMFTVECITVLLDACLLSSTSSFLLYGASLQALRFPGTWPRHHHYLPAGQRRPVHEAAADLSAARGRGFP